MGFFSFLKKKEVPAPTKPPARGESSPAPPVFHDTFREDVVPLPPKAEGAGGAESRPPDLLDEFPETKVGVEGGGSGGEARPRAPPVPPKEAGESAPSSPSASGVGGGAGSLADLVPEHPPSTEHPEGSVAGETGSGGKGGALHGEAPATALELPDFTPEEVVAAQRYVAERNRGLAEAAQHEQAGTSTPQASPREGGAPGAPSWSGGEETATVAEELPPLHDAEELLPTTKSGSLTSEDEYYVPAVQYRDALATIKGLREELRKGSLSLKSFLSRLTANKEPFEQFAEQLNEVQRKLIQMDNELR